MIYLKATTNEMNFLFLHERQLEILRDTKKGNGFYA